MAVKVNPTTSQATHHISLSDGVTEYGFILRSGDRINPRAIERRARQNGQYSPFTQTDWGSGRGVKNAQDDRSKFADSYRAVTRHTGEVFNAGQENYTTGYRDAEANMPGHVTFKDMLAPDQYVARKFTASASSNRSAIYLWVKRIGSPASTLTVELCSDSAGDPGTVLKTVTKTTSDITDTVSQLVEFTFSAVQAVTASTAYWIKVYTSGADTAADHWQVGADAADTANLTKDSPNGVTWIDATWDLYFRIVDDVDLLGGLFFQYKGQQYFITRQSGSTAPKIWMNGYRGVATGSHSTTTLQDTTQTFTADELIGATLLIYDGTNSEWTTPYRTITDNDTDTITFSPAFPKAPVSGDTVYVVVGSNVWTEITGHGLTVLPTDVVSSGDIVYFAQGDKTKMRRMREYINNAAWTREFAAENNYAKYLVTYRHPTKGLMICKANDAGNTGVPLFSQAPAQHWGANLTYSLLITDCEDTTGWTAGANVAIATDNADFVTKTKSIKATISGAPDAVSWYYAFTSVYAAELGAVRFWVKSAANMAEGVLTCWLSNSADASTKIESLTVPSLPAGIWTEVTLPYNKTTAGTGWPQSLGFNYTASSGTIHLDGIELFPVGSETKLGNKGEVITGLERYGDPEVPWVFRASSAGSIENGIFSPIPLREYSTAESVYNGRGHTVHNVYLYFSFLHGLERFYRNNLDDVGPNRDDGMPDGRRGYITDMVGYIGRFFYNYDVQAGYGAIMESSSGTDHHEVYRSSTTGRRIRNIAVQTIPGSAVDRLWFTEGEDILWLPLPGNTLNERTDDTFTHTHESVLETGWILGGERDAVKIFHSVKLFTENTSANRPIGFDYKTDEDTSWTAVSSSFTTPPVEKIVLNVSAKRIKLRFRLQTDDNTETPVIKAMVVSATTRPEIRYTFTFSTWAEDFPLDLEGNEDTSLKADTVLSKLDAWTAANTILTMRSVFTPFDNKQVILEPVVTRPLSIIIDESNEKLLVTMSLIEP